MVSMSDSDTTEKTDSLHADANGRALEGDDLDAYLARLDLDQELALDRELQNLQEHDPEKARRVLAVAEAQAAALKAEDALSAERQDTDRETAVGIAESADLFRSADGAAYATVEIDGHRENLPVRSRRFKAWLALGFRADKGKSPSTDALSIAQTHAEAVAELEGEEHEVFVRVGHAANRIYVDLCDADWRVIEVDADGWRVVTDPPLKFARPADALPLPQPIKGGSLDALRPFVNAGSDEDWRMMVAWLIGALAPAGPYPVLCLYGEQGSAKSTTSRRLREVIDPARTTTRETPRNTHDLAIAAKSCRVLAYDNLSYLGPEMSNALCRLATGGGFATRKLYSDDEEAMFYSQRPLIVNGIEEVATRGDLLSRAIVLQLPGLGQVRDERTMDEEFSADWPGVLGAVLDATSSALARRDSVRLDQAPRMADFAHWIEAAAPALGWGEGEFLRQYAGNREDAIGVEIEASSFASALLRFGLRDPWQGTAAELLDRLNREVDEGDRRKHWPGTAHAVGNRVRRHATALRSQGLDVSFRKSDGKRQIQLEPQDPKVSDALPI